MKKETNVDMSLNTQDIENMGQGLLGIARNLSSPNVSDSNFEEANIVDVLDDCARGLFSIAKAIRGLQPKSYVTTEDAKKKGAYNG